MSVGVTGANSFATTSRDAISVAIPTNRWFSFARLSAVATLLLAPLAYGAVEPWAWGALYVLSFAGLALWALGSMREKVVHIVWSPLYWAAALFLIVGLVQYFGRLTADLTGTRDALIGLTTGTFFFFLAGQLFAEASNKTWRIFGLIVTAYAFLMGIFAILQFFSSQGLIYWTVRSRGSVFGPYVNHNDYAGLMEMLIPIGAAYALSRPQSIIQRILLAVAICIPTGSLLLSASRGGFMSFVGEILIFAGVLWKRLPARNARTTLLVGALGIVAATLFFFWITPQSVFTRLGTVSNVLNAPEATYGDRMLVALDSMRIFRDHPVVGIGLGSFGSVYPSYQSFPTDQLYPYAHNDYAQALAETGALGGLIILGALALFFRLAFGNLEARLARPRGWIQFGASVGVCGLLIHSLVDFNLHIPANAAWFAVCVGLSTLPISSGRRMVTESHGRQQDFRNKRLN